MAGRTSWCRDICAAFALAAAVAGTPHAGLRAQVTGEAVVSGSVLDSSGAPLANAEVRVLRGAIAARTDDHGRYNLQHVPLGTVRLEARRLGFRPETAQVAIAGAVASVPPIRLAIAPTTLAVVAVRADRRALPERLAGYYERLRAGALGYFLTRDQIDQGNPRQLTDVLRRVPGVDIYRSRVRLRGRSCAPLIWLDGVAMPAGEVDLNTFPPGSIEGIEVYASATGAPSRYQATRDESRCGTILLWSRGLDTEARRRVDDVPAATLEAMHARGEVMNPDEVETEAHLATGDPVLSYPPELLARGVGGAVVAEFVVDAAGRFERGTLVVVASPHPLFSRAVQDALEGARFEPGRVDGRPARQIVSMQFRFAPPRGR